MLPRQATRVLPQNCYPWSITNCGGLQRIGWRANAKGPSSSRPTSCTKAWLKISGDEQRDWNGRQHFFAAAAEAMRRILVDRARRRLAAKRGAGEACLDADELDIPAPAPDDQLLAVSEALEKFVLLDARKAELVKLRYFVGMTFEEAAEALGIAVPTAKQWWAYSRAWLRVEIAEAATGETSPQ